MDSNRGLWVALGVLVLVVVLAPLLGAGMMGWGMMGWPPPRGWTWGLGMALGAVAMLAFWGAVVLAVVLAVRALAGRPQKEDSALEILRRRFAAGEITREQYEEMRKVLEQ